MVSRREDCEKSPPLGFPTWYEAFSGGGVINIEFCFLFYFLSLKVLSSQEGDDDKFFDFY